MVAMAALAELLAMAPGPGLADNLERQKCLGEA